ncbi:MAG: hypothetical protein AB9835_05885 [Eubacteriales bacterium]
MKPLKKLLIIFVTAVLSLVICWGVVFAMDFNSCQNLQIPRFVVSTGDTSDEGGSGLYRGLGYSVKLRVHIDKDTSSPVVEAVEMSILGKVIAASVT